MKQITGMRFLLPVYIVLLFVMFVLPFYSAQVYSILRNTTSHLGAQSTPNAWIMNVVFILLGVSCILEAWLHLKHYWLHKILLTVFGGGLIMAAVFKHAPITEGIPYSFFEDELHSFFATLVGISFTLLAVSAAFIERTRNRRALALFVGLAATGFSVMIFNLPALAGLWQRLMFIVSFTWLIFFIEGIR